MPAMSAQFHQAREDAGAPWLAMQLTMPTSIRTIPIISPQRIPGV